MQSVAGGLAIGAEIWNCSVDRHTRAHGGQMTNRKYGISVTVTRDDLENVELEIKLPQVDRVKVEAENPALRHVFSLFDRAVENLPTEDK